MVLFWLKQTFNDTYSHNTSQRFLFHNPTICSLYYAIYLLPILLIYSTVNSINIHWKETRLFIVKISANDCHKQIWTCAKIIMYIMETACNNLLSKHMTDLLHNTKEGTSLITPTPIVCILCYLSTTNTGSEFIQP